LDMRITKTQIDRLGDRLREGESTADDLRMLDEYRLSFGEPFARVIKSISERLELEPTGRPAKTTQSIVEKLQRESIRLTQVQDIAGCRLVVGGAVDQDRVLASILEIFPDAHVTDRRTNPSHGYRAVHVVVEISDRTIEIQVRTDLQHLWAEFSEKLSDVVDSTIKYGGGDPGWRDILGQASAFVYEVEQLERVIQMLEEKHVDEAIIADARERLIAHKDGFLALFREGISKLDVAGGKNDLPN
jgi:putative GTP pyrophosphokinase